MMGHDSRSRQAGFVTLIAAGLAVGCTPSQTGYPPETPASINLPTDALGKIDFNALDKILVAFTVAQEHDDTLPCKTNPATCQVPMKVQEIGKSVDIRPEAGPGHFRIIGKWRNTDPTQVTARYDLQPNTTYYVWVEDAPYKAAPVYSRTRWGVIPRGGSKIAIGYVMACHTYPTSHTVSHLYFQYCGASPTKDIIPRARPDATAVRPSLFSFAVARTNSKTSADAIAETWFECPPGCCTGTSLL
jgi:hypothetical protein